MIHTSINTKKSNLMHDPKVFDITFQEIPQIMKTQKSVQQSMDHHHRAPVLINPHLSLEAHSVNSIVS